MISDEDFTSYFYITINSWTAVPGAEGYRIFKSKEYTPNTPVYNEYRDVTTNSAFNDGDTRAPITWNAGTTVTPNTC